MSPKAYFSTKPPLLITVSSWLETPNKRLNFSFKSSSETLLRPQVYIMKHKGGDNNIITFNSDNLDSAKICSLSEMFTLILQLLRT